MGIINTASYVVQRIVKKNNLMHININNSDLDIYLRNIPSDRQVFFQIFIKEDLAVKYREPPKIIIDGGANIGMATLYYKNKYPKAKVIAVEPEGSNFELLLKNTKPFSDVLCLNKGIWNKSCRLQIIDDGNGNDSFITKELQENELADVVIDAISITDLIKEFQLIELDLVKLDIEGSERNVFEKDFTEWLSKTKEIIVEIHPHLHPECETNVLNALNNDFTKSFTGEYSRFIRK
jgi:FkbM family methyltransferase